MLWKHENSLLLMTVWHKSKRHNYSVTKPRLQFSSQVQSSSVQVSSNTHMTANESQMSSNSSQN